MEAKNEIKNWLSDNNNGEFRSLIAEGQDFVFSRNNRWMFDTDRWVHSWQDVLNLLDEEVR